MTAAFSTLTVVLAAAVAVLAAVVVRLRRHAVRVEQALDSAQKSLEHLEIAFARFAPEDVVDRISDGRDVTAEEKDVTVMFADIRGFTTLSERVPPATMIEILNAYFTAMNRAITAHHGRISRIMGDGLLALFGALERNPWHAPDAARAAVAMRRALSELNTDLERKGLPRLSIGVGLHRGRVVAAVMGSDAKTEYTVIGDVVNTASRVESLTRTHDVDILVTADVERDLDARFVRRPMPPMPVKGKSEPVATFAIESYAD